MEHGVGRDDGTAALGQRLTDARVHVEAREVAARNVHADAVALLKDVRLS